jgi:hypothetical protein
VAPSFLPLSGTFLGLAREDAVSRSYGDRSLYKRPPCHLVPQSVTLFHFPAINAKDIRIVAGLERVLRNMSSKLFLQIFAHKPDPNEPLPVSNRPETIIGAIIPFLVLSWLAIALRIWVRSRVMRDLGWDDFFVILAGCSNTAASALVIACAYHYQALEPLLTFNVQQYNMDLVDTISTLERRTWLRINKYASSSRPSCT